MWNKAILFERKILANHITLEDRTSTANIQEYILNKAKENFEIQVCFHVVIVTPICLFIIIFYEPNELGLRLIFQLIKMSWAGKFNLSSWAEPSWMGRFNLASWAELSFFRNWIWRAELSWAQKLGSAQCELWAEL